MNKKTITTMLVACALSVSALSTTAVFAEDAVVTGETPAVTETTTTPGTTTPDTTTPVAYEPEATLVTTKWTGDSDIVIDVDEKGGSYYGTGETYVWGKDGAQPFVITDPEVEVNEEVNEEGKGKITFTKDALKNALMLDMNYENQSAIDWTKINQIEIELVFVKDDQFKSRTIYVETSVKAPEITVTPTTPAQPSTPAKPAKPAENKGTTTTTATTTTKKEAPKTGDTMNVALYASLLVVSALFAVVLTTKKRITE